MAEDTGSAVMDVFVVWVRLVGPDGVVVDRRRGLVRGSDAMDAAKWYLGRYPGYEIEASFHDSLVGSSDIDRAGNRWIEEERARRRMEAFEAKVRLEVERFARRAEEKARIAKDKARRDEAKARKAVESARRKKELQDKRKAAAERAAREDAAWRDAPIREFSIPVDVTMPAPVVEVDDLGPDRGAAALQSEIDRRAVAMLRFAPWTRRQRTRRYEGFYQ